MFAVWLAVLQQPLLSMPMHKVNIGRENPLTEGYYPRLPVSRDGFLG